MSTGDNTFIHLLAGGLGGTAGAIITCPLEVVKTRLQSSSVSSFAQTVNVSMIQCDSSAHIRGLQYSTSTSVANTRLELRPSRHFGSFGIFHCLKHIVTTEGPKALLKGLGPNLVGVAPQRAIYFYTYAQSKVLFNGVLSPDSPQVHLCSAACAGFVSSTITNPIWFIKTRLQLDHSTNGGLSAFRCIQQIYGAHGIRGFYKGITASYYGISETVIHLVIYEAIKERLSCTMLSDPDQLGMLDFIRYMAAGATSKTIATCLAYPHEVARTRLREEGNKFNAFWQTLFLVFREDGVPGLYRGLGTQLVRQIPNTAIMMATYEAVVYICQKQFNKS